MSPKPPKSPSGTGFCGIFGFSTVSTPPTTTTTTFILLSFLLPSPTGNGKQRLQVCRFAGSQRVGKKCGYRACLVGKEMRASHHQLTSFHFYPVAGAKRKLTKFRLTEFCAGAAGNSSTEYGYTKIFTNEKQGAKIPLIKVLEILKNFFQEVFKQGLGQSPKVFPREVSP